MIKALVFDFDGLIVDTEMSSYQTWQEIYAEHDCQLPFSTWAICIGGSPQLFDPCEYLEQQIGRPVLREEIRLRRRQQHIRMVEAQPVLPGVEDYILSAKRLGLKIGVASSSRHEWVDTHLTRLGLIDYFDSIKCFDDVKRTKPDPELYLAVLDALGVHGQQAIALEDSPNGVIAAQQAGIFCVAVPNPVTSQLSLLHADLCLSSLTEVSLEQLLAKVGGTVKHEHIH
ncbi:MAG: HAD family hydrolase [Chloroflexi bacterium]|nr:MAG: HAD family hydrolase [Chloroflexota bacterium]TMC97003.1 MAG: HAD family hydrolase [Chloroflexota bacterium]